MPYREWIGNVKRASVSFQIESDGYNLEVQKLFSRLNFKNINSSNTNQTCSITGEFLNSNAINYNGGTFLMLNTACCNYLQPIIISPAPDSQDDWELIGNTTPEVGESQNIYGYVSFNMTYNWLTNKMSTTDVVPTYLGEYDVSSPPPANYIANPQIKTINRLESSKVSNIEQIIYYNIGDISNNVVGGYSWNASFDQDGNTTNIDYIGSAGHAFKITWLSPYNEYYIFDCGVGNHYLLGGSLDPDNYPSFEEWKIKEYNIYDFVMYNNTRYECIKKIDKYELDNYPNSKKPPYNITTQQRNSTYWKIWDYTDHIQILKYPNGLHFIFKGAYYDKIINDPESSYTNLKMIKFTEYPEDDSNSPDGFPSEAKPSYNPHLNRAQYVTYTNAESIISAILYYKIGEDEVAEPETVTVADYVNIRSPGNGGSMSSSRTQDGVIISASCSIV